MSPDPHRAAPMARGVLPLLAEGLILFGFAALIASALGLRLLNSGNWPTGGDAASHLLYAWLYGDELFSGRIIPWVPEVFAGMPFLSYYFPLPFMVIAALSKVIGLAPAFKWGSFLAAMLLPGAVCVAGRRWLALPWPAALLGALGALAFVLHEQHSIWGGNLLSTLSGEFAYSYGLIFAVLAAIAWVRALHIGRGWVVAALLEAASGFSHGFPLLVVGFSTALLWVDAPDRRRAIRFLIAGHLLAFCLLAGWLWPMLEMHGIAIPNDASFPLGSWRELLPATLWPVFALGLLALVSCAFPLVRSGISSLQARALRFFFSSAGVAALGFLAGDQLGLADIRFFPMVWVFTAIASGWMAGLALSALSSAAFPRAMGWARALLCAAAALGLLGWIATHVSAAPDWGLWNHAGLDSKPQWHNLTRVFPAMKGTLWSPRLVFEHDPANSDIGSTRTLEALPMFLGHRPVLEGLYMESALIGPAVYQLQSEVSARPSSPLVRFPSGSLDVAFAAQHMNFLHADTVLLRSAIARRAVEASGLFEKTAESPPFAVYRLRHFDSQLAAVVNQPIRVRPERDWMDDAFAWFRTRSRFNAYLPVYGAPQSLADAPTQTTGKAPKSTAQVTARVLDRYALEFETTATGRPHLIKMAWHPRWHLRSRGKLFKAGPGFMLVVPAEPTIRLEYGHTAVGVLGMLASGAAALGLLIYFLRGRWRLAPQAERPSSARRRRSRRRPLLVVWLLMAAVGVWYATRAPEREYSRAWESMRANRYAEAAADFLLAYERRRPKAKKEEALFWLAKSSELAGRFDEAAARYRELVENYHGYWVPESLYTLVVLDKVTAGKIKAKAYAARLRAEHPENQWARKLDNVKETPNRSSPQNLPPRRRGAGIQ